MQYTLILFLCPSFIDYVVFTFLDSNLCQSCFEVVTQSKASNAPSFHIFLAQNKMLSPIISTPMQCNVSHAHGIRIWLPFQIFKQTILSPPAAIPRLDLSATLRGSSSSEQERNHFELLTNWTCLQTDWVVGQLVPQKLS